MQTSDNNNYNKYQDQEEKDFKKICPNHPFTPTVMPAKHRIIAIGDIHGDYELTLKCLRLAKLIDNNNNNDNINWIGGDTVVVQIGDQIDRCRPSSVKCNNPNATLNDEHSDIKILELFTKLDKQARKHNGYVISLLGNHELMNVAGILDYVSYKGIHEFKDPDNPNLSGEAARINSFKPGNKYSTFMGCTRMSCVIIGNILFAHAGIIPQFLKKLKIKHKHDLKDFNAQVRLWLLNLITKQDYLYDIISGKSNNSLFWDRILGGIPPDACQKDNSCTKFLEPVLKILKINKMVIGHTPQFSTNKSGINGTCDGRLWRVDNGASTAFSQFDENYLDHNVNDDTRQPQVLEILDDDINKTHIKVLS